ncbi:MAG TPA: type I DNA topoisomerase [Abditibacteriaceae bacterium]|jgi:DNA topoisomerase-1
MSKSLVIVESPTKVKTLKGFLGADFTIMGSKGHVRDLPKSGLSIDIKNDFEPSYELLPDRHDVVDAMKKAARGCDTIYLASDPDREGEAIAWHISQALGAKNMRRIEFNEITKTAVLRALDNPRDIDMDRVNAQQARRVLDRIIGYQVSPILARKISKGLSAGRVQSVAVRLIVEREREIQAFKIEEYWSITAQVSPKVENFPFPARLLTQAGKKLEIVNEEQATTHVDALRPLPYNVSNVKRQEKRRNPLAPFITSTLQQEASKQLRYTSKRTMMVAQSLYEGIALGDGQTVGLITYMRTDSTTIAAEAQAAARELISSRFGPEFVPDAPPKYKNKKSAQEAHEAIRPSYVDKIPEEIKQYLTDEQFKLYRLIWRRFIASQMKPAVMDVTTVDIAAGDYGLRASGSIIKFAGFLSVYEEAKDEDAPEDAPEDDENALRKLPELAKDQPLDLKELQPRQHFTQPPPRYTEATLVKALEENGIGRPSTYAQTLSTIQDRKYVELAERRFAPTDLGFIVNDKLVQHFPDIVNIQFTAGMEEKLDEVEEGRENWVHLLQTWYEPFAATLALAKDEMEKIAPEETDFDCPSCGKKLLKRRGRFGEFFSCSGYPECKCAMDISAEGEPKQREKREAPVVEGIEPGETRECDKCGKPMVVRASARGAFWGCTGYPKCKNLIPIEGAKVEMPAAELTEHKCPNCEKPLALRKGRFGPFLGCTGYPDCKTIVNLDKDGNPRAPREPKEATAKTAAKKPAKKTAAKKPAAKKPAAKTAAAKATETEAA